MAKMCENFTVTWKDHLFKKIWIFVVVVQLPMVSSSGGLFPYPLNEHLILKVSNGPSNVNILQGLCEYRFITGVDLRMFTNIS